MSKEKPTFSFQLRSPVDRASHKLQLAYLTHERIAQLQGALARIWVNPSVGIFSALCLALQIDLIRNRNRWQRSLDCLLRWRSRNAAPMTDRLLSGSRNCLLDVWAQLRSTNLQRSVLCQPTNCCTRWFCNLSEKRGGVPWKRLPQPWFRVKVEKCLWSLLPFPRADYMRVIGTDR